MPPSLHISSEPNGNPGRHLEHDEPVELSAMSSSFQRRPPSVDMGSYDVSAKGLVLEAGLEAELLALVPDVAVAIHDPMVAPAFGRVCMHYAPKSESTMRKCKCHGLPMYRNGSRDGKQQYTCRIGHNRRIRKQRLTREEKGRCSRCWKKDRKVAPGKKCCDDCLAELRDRDFLRVRSWR